MGAAMQSLLKVNGRRAKLITGKQMHIGGRREGQKNEQTNTLKFAGDQRGKQKWRCALTEGFTGTEFWQELIKNNCRDVTKWLTLHRRCGCRRGWKWAMDTRKKQSHYLLCLLNVTTLQPIKMQILTWTVYTWRRHWATCSAPCGYITFKRRAIR